MESEIKLIHLPTGTVIIENESRSSHVNREKAFERLKEIIPDYKREDILIEKFTLA